MNMDTYYEDLVWNRVRTFDRNSPIGSSVSGTDEQPDATYQQSNWHRTFNIIRAINEGSPLTTIQNLLEVPDAPMKVSPIRKLQWRLFDATIKKVRNDVLEFLLQKGLDPNVTPPDSDVKRDTTALQVAVECGDLEAVGILLRHGANVNVGKLHDRLPHSGHALYGAFQKDNPALMELLIRGYDSTSITDGKSAFHLACECGAVKCVDKLLNQEGCLAEIRDKQIPLHLGICHGAKLIRKLYEVGSEDGVYTTKDIGKCLLCVTQQSTFEKSRFGSGFPSDITDIITMLLQLGADVNFKETNGKSPLEVLISNPPNTTDTHAINSMVSLLLSHGGRARLSEIKAFMMRAIKSLISGHLTSHVATAKTISSLSAIVSVLQQEKYTNQITTPLGLPPSSFSSSRRLSGRIRHGHALIVFNRSEGQACCPAVKDLLRTMVLKYDITTELLGEFTNGVVRCDCGSYMAELLISIRPHKEYQEQVEYLHQHAAALRDNRYLLVLPNPLCDAATLSRRFPALRSLRLLCRATIYNTLHYPKDVSCARLMLPKPLQKMICLLW